MRLKRLEIIGFKSFRDKTVLDFSQGITAVVGPNGCGKSNVVDAIRWVMGEQRMKMLRGKRMDDLIFHGTEGAAPVGMTEVSLILDANGQQFPGEYADCSDVMISRRLFRDGESEYSINKVSCRLLDVRDFFMSAGLGTRTYSLVEQNSIVNLVEAKPEERRQFIEDAAGISKYKVRKEAATRKMEATSQNLLRLNDIIREVKTQLNAVSRQARRAEQFKSLRKEIKEAELTLALQSYTDLSRKRESLEEECRTHSEKETQVRVSLDTLETSVDLLKAELLESETRNMHFQEKLYGIRNAIAVREKEIEYAKGKVTEISLRKQKSSAELETLGIRQENLTGEINILITAGDSSDEKIQHVRNNVLYIQKEVERLKAIAGSLHGELEENKIELIDVVAEKAKLKNTLSGLAKGMEDLGKRKERDLRDIQEHKATRDALLRDLKVLKTMIRMNEETLTRLRENEKTLIGEHEKEKQNLRSIDELLSQMREEAGRKSSRLSSLQEMMYSYAWCGEGTKSIMALTKGERTQALPGESFLGLVADILEVPREYETAAEAVLGEKLQYVVVKSQQDGVKAIDYLKTHCLGRGSFVPLEVRNHHDYFSSEDHLQGALRLIDMVTVHRGFEKIAEYLLGDVLLIPNLTRGISRWEQNGFQGTFVTPEGDIINTHGVLTGGSKENGDRSLLSTKRELTEMEEEICRLNAALQEKTDERRNTSALIEGKEGELLQLRSDIHALELQINGERKDEERLDHEIKGIEQRLTVLTYNYETLQFEEKDIEERSETLQKEIAGCEERERSVNDAISYLHDRWAETRADVDEQEERLTGEKILLVSLEEKRSADLRTLARLQADRTNIAGEIEGRVKELEQYDREIEHTITRIGIEENLLEQLYSDCETAEGVIAEIKTTHQEKDSLLRDREMEIKDVKKTLDEIVRGASELEMSCRELTLQMDNLQKGIQGKYYVDLVTLPPDFQILEEEAILELTARLDKNRQNVENFGEVNLLALSEYEQLKERHDFLTKQVSDLNASLDTLRKTITKINAISRKRFGETFDAVNECFKVVFNRIFPGGKGELRLTDEADLLETGVDINIVMPGKRAQSVSLLSGGEKSLAAIALIFAILMYRPSPFLVLDEVDAALDDANIALFNGLIKDISENSQIIMVTHNKKTMEVAEYLFGVTMQKQGISTMVSVALN